MSDANSTTAGTGNCVEISLLCPVTATVLGYYPNLGSGIFFALAFGLLTIASAFLTVWKRTWSYGVGITLGLVMEVGGYVGRILLHQNPWNAGAFDLQICTIIIAPTFICVSIYLTLKHVALHLSPQSSRLQPRWYPIIFLPADLTCLVVQGIGGGLASTKTNLSVQRAGSRSIIAGVALQVVVLLVFGTISLDYFQRARKHMASPEAQGSSGLRLWNDARFRRFGYAISGAYIAMLIRCIYRIAEMAGGWGNFIMQDEPSFLVLDSSLVLVATSLLVIFHPGIFFPQMRNGQGKKIQDDAGISSANEENKEEAA